MRRRERSEQRGLRAAFPLPPLPSLGGAASGLWAWLCPVLEGNHCALAAYHHSLLSRWLKPTLIADCRVVWTGFSGEGQGQPGTWLAGPAERAGLWTVARSLVDTALALASQVRLMPPPLFSRPWAHLQDGVAEACPLGPEQSSRGRGCKKQHRWKSWGIQPTGTHQQEPSKPRTDRCLPAGCRPRPAWGQDHDTGPGLQEMLAASATAGPSAPAQDSGGQEGPEVRNQEATPGPGPLRTSLPPLHPTVFFFGGVG